MQPMSDEIIPATLSSAIFTSSPALNRLGAYSKIDEANVQSSEKANNTSTISRFSFLTTAAEKVCLLHLVTGEDIIGMGKVDTNYDFIIIRQAYQIVLQPHSGGGNVNVGLAVFPMIFAQEPRESISLRSFNFLNDHVLYCIKPPVALENNYRKLNNMLLMSQ
jgi:hypothetical protein